jgi:hypothetical protein
MNHTKCLLLALALALVPLMAGVALAQVQLDQSVVSSGGGVTSSATTQMTFTMGQPAVGLATDNLYDMDIGFWTPLIGGLSPVPGTDTPTVFRLDQNYPNPFNPRTVISFSLPEAAPVNLSIYNVRGERVRVLYDGDQAAGHHQYIWDGTNDSGQGVASGAYLVRIVSSAGVQNRKMLLAR